MSPKHHTTVFLLGAVKPSKIMVLKRAANKSFAPGLYTGIGGKHEEGETVEQAAYRELEEETGIKGLTLHEFARQYVNNGVSVVHYYSAIAASDVLPECNEGDLEWIDVDKLSSRPFIPGTREVLEEWRKRDFSTEKTFSLYTVRMQGNEKLELLDKKLVEGLG